MIQEPPVSFCGRGWEISFKFSMRQGEETKTAARERAAFSSQDFGKKLSNVLEIFAKFIF